MLNKAMIIGRLGKDPDVRYTQSGMAICSMNIATDESYVDQDGNKVERVEWHSVVAFQRQAENCSEYLAKGSLVFIEGSLQTRKWQDQNGQDRHITEIRAQRIQFLDKRSDTASKPDTDTTYRRPSTSHSQNQKQATRKGSQYSGKRAEQFPTETSEMDDSPF